MALPGFYRLAAEHRTIADPSHLETRRSQRTQRNHQDHRILSSLASAAGTSVRFSCRCLGLSGFELNRDAAMALNRDDAMAFVAPLWAPSRSSCFELRWCDGLRGSFALFAVFVFQIAMAAMALNCDGAMALRLRAFAPLG
jgi:hypothetical protein